MGLRNRMADEQKDLLGFCNPEGLVALARSWIQARDFTDFYFDSNFRQSGNVNTCREIDIDLQPVLSFQLIKPKDVHCNVQLVQFDKIYD